MACAVPQFHLPARRETGTYAPRLYGAARIHFADRKRKIDETRRVAFVAPLESSTRTMDWDTASAVETMPEALLVDAPAPAPYLPLPAAARDLAVFARWAKGFDRWLARTQRLEVPERPDGAEGNPPVRPKRGGVSVELLAIAWELT
jgi:hypothetical protein